MTAVMVISPSQVPEVRVSALFGCPSHFWRSFYARQLILTVRICEDQDRAAIRYYHHDGRRSLRHSVSTATTVFEFGDTAMPMTTDRLAYIIIIMMIDEHRAAA